jgi:sulfite reductase alpha subunit-like flavoprotein
MMKEQETVIPDMRATHNKDFYKWSATYNYRTLQHQVEGQNIHHYTSPHVMKKNSNKLTLKYGNQTPNDKYC